MNLGHFDATYSVTHHNGGVLPPVTLHIQHGPILFTDLLTPDEADLLAGSLRAAARQERLRLDAIRNDLECVADAAHKPYETKLPGDYPRAA